MPYATVMDVQRLEPLREFTAATEPSADQVVGYLDDVAAEMDGALAARKYKLPVAASATLSLRLLRRINAQGAHALVQAGAPATKNEAFESSWARYQEALRGLASGQTELPDAGSDAAQQVAI